MSTTLINQLLSCASTKHKLTYHRTHVSLEHFTGKAVNVVVVCDTDYHPRSPTKEHSHVEADTLIPPHVILRIQECILQETHVWSPDRHKRPNSIHGLGWSRQKDLNRLPPISWWKWQNIWHFWPLWRKIHLRVNCGWQENPTSHASQCLNPGDILV